MSHVTLWISHVTRMNESCHTCERVTSHVRMRHVTHMKKSCRTNKRVKSHIWLSHITNVNESRHKHEWVTSHTWMSHVTYRNESCHVNESHIWTSHVAQKQSFHEWTLCPNPKHKKHITTPFWVPMLQTLLHMAWRPAEITREMVREEINIDSKKRNLNRALYSQKSPIFHEGHYNMNIVPFICSETWDDDVQRDTVFFTYIRSVGYSVVRVCVCV